MAMAIDAYFETTNTGFRVIDGDRIADAFLSCVTSLPIGWQLALNQFILTTNLRDIQNRLLLAKPRLAIMAIIRVANNEITKFMASLVTRSSWC